jgi:hypothetical protein
VGSREYYTTDLDDDETENYNFSRRFSQKNTDLIDANQRKSTCGFLVVGIYCEGVLYSKMCHFQIANFCIGKYS